MPCRAAATTTPAVVLLDVVVVVVEVVVVVRRVNTALGTSPDGAYRWLHAKPLNAATGRVLAPYRPGGRHGRRRRRHVKTHTKHSF